MRTPIRWQVTGVVGAGVLGLPLLSLLWAAPPAPLLEMVDPSPVLVPHTLSQAALHEAAFWRVRAIQLADDECDDARAALSAWDPAAAFNQKEARGQFLARDRAGYLRRARTSARRAAALARTLKERRRAERELREVDGEAGFSTGSSSRNFSDLMP
jgi:hypothetical protein